MVHCVERKMTAQPTHGRKRTQREHSEKVQKYPILQ